MKRYGAPILRPEPWKMIGVIALQGFQTIAINNLSLNFWNIRREINEQEFLKVWVWKIKLLFYLEWLHSYSEPNAFIFVLCMYYVLYSLSADVNVKHDHHIDAM